MEMTVNLTDLFLIIAGISLIIMMLFLVPLLIQLRQSAQQAEKLLNDLNHDLPPIIASLKSTVEDIRKVTEHVETKISDTDAFISTAIYAGESLLLTSRFIRSALQPAVTQLGGLGAGIKTFFKVIHESKSKKRAEEQADE
jgi:uncharacterized protein YoxC